MLVLGHRGNSIAFAENTLEAFRSARSQGADGVELDVRRTADGGLAVRHDEHVPDGRALLDLDVDELPATLPLLAAALDACEGLSVVNIEIKNLPGEGDFDLDERVARDVVALIGARGDGARMLVSSFHLPTIDRVHELDPELATGWLVVDPGDPQALVDRVVPLGHRAIHPHHAFVNAPLVEVAHAAGLAVNTWTCDDPDRIRWLASVGVDGVVTNDPAGALAALGR